MGSRYVKEQLAKMYDQLKADHTKLTERFGELLMENTQLKKKLEAVDRFDAGEFVLVPRELYAKFTEVSIKIAALAKRND